MIEYIKGPTRFDLYIKQPWHKLPFRFGKVVLTRVNSKKRYPPEMKILMRRGQITLSIKKLSKFAE